MPVSRTVRWWIVLLAGLSWPFAYAVKLGQVGPILLPAVRDRLALARRADPARRQRGAGHGHQAPARDHLRVGGADRPVPGAWLSVVVVLAGLAVARDPARRPGRLVRLRDAGPPGRRPDHDRAQLHARGDRLPARVSPAATASIIQLASTVVVLGAVVAVARDGPPPRRRTWSRSSPASCSRRSCGTTTRCCCCCRSPTSAPRVAGGRCSSRWSPRCRWSGSRRRSPTRSCFFVDAGRDVRGRDPSAPGAKRHDRERPSGRPRPSSWAWWSSASPRSSTGSPTRGFDAGRGDFFYLADAFLHGRTWLTFRRARTT